MCLIVARVRVIHAPSRQYNQFRLLIHNITHHLIYTTLLTPSSYLLNHNTHGFTHHYSLTHRTYSITSHTNPPRILTTTRRPFSAHSFTQAGANL